MERSIDKLRWNLTLGFLLLLAAGLFKVMQPFIVPIAWAIVLVMTTWPLYRRVRRLLPQYPGLSAFLMTLGLASVIVALVGPIFAGVTSEARQIRELLQSWSNESGPFVESALERVPLLSEQHRAHITSYLQELYERREQLFGVAAAHPGEIVKLVSFAARGVLGFLAGLLICLFVSFFLYRHGALLARQLQRALRRIGGERFERILHAIRATIRGAVYGILATAVAQGVLATLGYLAAGVPVPLLFGFATVVAALIPFGTPFVYLPAAALAVMQTSWLAGLLLAAWGVVVVSSVDNLLRPIFISQATESNLLLVFFGVLGGVLAFGFIGILVGPALIAIALVLWHEWVDVREPAASNTATTTTARPGG